jgi:hypothetical protein
MRSASSRAALGRRRRGPSLVDLAAPQLVERGRGSVLGQALTTAAAFTRALSDPNGIEPCPGVPRTVRRRQATPFSPTVTPTVGAVAGPPCRPPFSVST